MSDIKKKNNSPFDVFKRMNIFWIYALILGVLLVGYMTTGNEIEKEVTWSEFKSYAEKGGITSITVLSNKNEAIAQLSDTLAQKIFT